MSKRWKIWDISLALVILLRAVMSAHLTPSTNITIRKEPGICQSLDIRNSVDMFSQLKGCRVVEGFVQIVLIDKANDSDYSNFSFPELREITDYLLLYRVHGLRSLGQIFPKLSVIRGNTLFLNYALVVYEMLHLQDLGLTSLTNIIRGSVYFAKNPMLCFVDSIDWDLIAPAGKGEHYITGNKLQNECPLCPSQNQSCPNSTITGYPLCWNSLHCQRVCPSRCSGSCNENGTCCHSSCLGGCRGPTNEDCIACRHVLFQNKCIKACPNGTYEFVKRRCVLESECYDMLKPKEVNDFNLRYNPWKPFRNECLIECPSGYIEVETSIQGEKRYTCEPCKGVCKKECTGASVDSIASAQRLRGCTSIKGALEIQIRGGSNVVRELEENLNMIEEIDEYLKIVRSFPMISLNFLRKLKVIHGYKLESSKYALVVLDNQNLAELWDWERKDGLKIENGKLFFHFNPKLCLYKIKKLKQIANLSDYTDSEVATNSNGDKVACNVTELKVNVSNKSKTVVLIKWKPFTHFDPRSLLGYIVYSIEAPFQNVTMYDGRDACGSDGWRVDDVSKDESDEEVTHILTRLKPYTQYAFYVRTYTIATENQGGQSKIQYFRTLPDTPSQPHSLKVITNSSHEIILNWQPPVNPNGNLTHYIITGHWERDSEDYLDKRNYCLDPFTAFDPKHVTHKPKVDEMYEKEKVQQISDLEEALNSSCSCKKKFMETRQREKEIHFEDNLHNLIYVKNPDIKRRKRDMYNGLVSNHVYSSDKRPSSSTVNEIENGLYVRFSHTVKEPSIVIKNLQHFAIYSIGIQACRQWEEEENTTSNENCSKEAIVSVRTLRNPTADNLDPHYIVVEPNKTTGEVHVKWKDPPSPNSLILLYQIQYKRADVDNYQPTHECITRKKFHDQGNNYIIKNLPPGNYSLCIRAQSLAGNGEYTPIIYFNISPDNQISMLNVSILIFFGIVLILVVAFAMYYHLRRQYTQVPNRKLIASVNPEYVPTVYVPDDWEVARSRVDLLQDIGQGSFGMVYEGRLKSADGSTTQACAVKTVNVQAADRDRIEFLNEASVMKAFNTHHVVKLLGVISVGEPALVIMELMRLGDLKSYLRSQRPDSDEETNVTPPSLKRILQMAAEIADGMAYLSAKKFVHRDLAARNCMVTQDLTVKIGDFGMTRDIYETDYYRKGSKGLLPVRWMAPESLKDGVFTSYSDAWSYGVVVYEMATLASQPYQGLSNDQVLRYVKEGGIMERPDNCPDKLYNLMRLCWQYKPNSRPTFMEIVALLQSDVNEEFRHVSFYHSEEGVEFRSANGTVKTAPTALEEMEDFSLSDDDDYKDLHSSASSKFSSRSSTPNGYVPQIAVKTTKC